MAAAHPRLGPTGGSPSEIMQLGAQHHANSIGIQSARRKLKTRARAWEKGEDNRKSENPFPGRNEVMNERKLC